MPFRAADMFYARAFFAVGWRIVPFPPLCANIVAASSDAAFFPGFHTTSRDVGKPDGIGGTGFVLLTRTA